MKLVFLLFFSASCLYFLIHVRKWSDIPKEGIFYLLVVGTIIPLFFGMSAFHVVFLNYLVTELSGDTKPPYVHILSPEKWGVYTTNIVQVQAEVIDDQDTNPQIQGVGTFHLQSGFNTIVVTATDKSGNVGSDYTIVEQKP
ncbi:hypothetical protein IPN35_01805 [Candidatus Peregrinibacteria bacterium]|nr:MAG: hypothetical protein IPN35_01805 [Candidatus Peregrinibacteria bacterium]